MCSLDTHLLRRHQKYQWLSTPLALHGVVAKTDGSSFPSPWGRRGRAGAGHIGPSGTPFQGSADKKAAALIEARRWM